MPNGIKIGFCNDDNLFLSSWSIESDSYENDNTDILPTHYIEVPEEPSIDDKHRLALKNEPLYGAEAFLKSFQKAIDSDFKTPRQERSFVPLKGGEVFITEIIRAVKVKILNTTTESIISLSQISSINLRQESVLLFLKCGRNIEFTKKDFTEELNIIEKYLFDGTVSRRNILKDSENENNS